MPERFYRTAILIGKEGVERLSAARVAVFGIGGVGGYTVEALVRSGIGTLDLVDSDRICITNINRQIHATTKTIGQYKVDAARERILEINPDITVNSYRTFYGAETSNQFDYLKYDYIVDAIDTVSSKLELIVKAGEYGVPIISCMGAGNKMNPAGFEVSDIYETSVCPLAKVMRRELRKRRIKNLKVVYSKEVPIKSSLEDFYCNNLHEANVPRRHIPGSNAFVPASAGLIIAGEVVKDLLEIQKQ